MRKVHFCIKLEISICVVKHTSYNQLKTFITNRVSKIQRLTETCVWTHVPTHLNPADLVSRGLRLCDLPDSDLWWRGSPFLEQCKLSSAQTSSGVLNEKEYSGELKANATFETPV
ncbi:integrase catalytic domain-containing protein [Trichonephila inaurata madagascariensis]|uniref:Integrase catalytic domain-containing protein n=1 Tax=Trichonephila inaurata madagascariensis TaxID=2747483 RepID=A0A8X6XR17_9ARAC|nr:integrase catalytic domain-containing protein [Trichonephila inaurata madagascariensis]GFY61376.1 integrase catalytic domain-containing protein [Trichonephila inaurata madagascariensis]